MYSHRTGAKRAVSDGNITKMWKESKEKEKIDKVRRKEKRIEISDMSYRIGFQNSEVLLSFFCVIQ